MPRYVCDECGTVFGSKDGLREHLAEADHDERELSVSVPDVSGALQNIWSTGAENKILVMFAAVLMGTLFLGTAQYASSLATPGGGGGSDAGRFVNPLTGYRADTVPDASIDYVSGGALSDDEQLYVLYRGSEANGPAVLLQYNCVNCPGIVEDLVGVAQQYPGYVYVAPYEGESRVAATSFRNVRTGDALNRTELSGFVCATYQGLQPRYRPLACDQLG